jgi:anti-anti-sigma factor
MRAAGELDAAAAEPLARMLEEQCAAGNCFARLDLAEVDFLDPAALCVLVDSHAQFLAAGGTLVLTGVGPQIAGLLRRAGLDRMLFTIARATDPSPVQTTRGLPSGGAPTQRADRSSTTHDRQAVIDQAVGIVMGRGRCGVVEATERLRLVSRATNRTLREVAESVIDEATRTGLRTPAVTHPGPGSPPTAPGAAVGRSAVIVPGRHEHRRRSAHAPKYEPKRRLPGR